MINTAEQHQISGLGFITTPDAFIPWRGVKVSGIVLFLKLMTLPNIRDFASAEELVVLINLEDTNADLIRQEVPKIERLKY
jgi:hypothetical protein